MLLNPSFLLGLQTFRANALRLSAGKAAEISLGDNLDAAFEASGLPEAIRALNGPIKQR